MFDKIKKTRKLRKPNPSSQYETERNYTQEFNEFRMELSERLQEDTVQRSKIIKPDGRMSMVNMIASSHLLSMSQNGREFLLTRYPAIVQKYVEQVVEADAVDANLKALNQKIVDRLTEEAGRYE